MSSEVLILLAVFVMVTSGVIIAWTLFGKPKSKLEDRLRGLSGGTESPPEPITMTGFTHTALPRMGTTLVPTDEAERTRLKARLVYAGYYSRQAMPVFLGVKMLLMITPAIIGLIVGSIGLVPLRIGLLGGACMGIFGMVGPSLWLDRMKSKRQSSLRRSLPDALDLLVICLEGGLSLPGSLARISVELKSAHGNLAVDLGIVQREIQLGRSPGEALQEMGKRTDLEEIRSLASVITQAERFGASLANSLRVHSEILREKRQQRAEEMGQKAATKVLFPTLLFIFPAIFVVILGPAAIQIYRTLGINNP
jgi:tight adherence protein C